MSTEQVTLWTADEGWLIPPLPTPAKGEFHICIPADLYLFDRVRDLGYPYHGHCFAPDAGPDGSCLLLTTAPDSETAERAIASLTRLGVPIEQIAVNPGPDYEWEYEEDWSGIIGSDVPATAPELERVAVIARDIDALVGELSSLDSLQALQQTLALRAESVASKAQRLTVE